MSFDLAFSESIDLIVSGARDLAGASGDAITQQRIVTRLKIEQGSWVLDDSGNLGSQINRNLGSPLPRFEDSLPDLIRLALTDMIDISVDEIQIEETGTSQVLAKISYSYLPELDSIPNELPEDLSGQSVVVPIGTSPQVGVG